jgi:hypothetical protein
VLNPKQFVGLVLEPALQAMTMYSVDAMYLMAATGFVESKLTHLKQIPNGPALGLWQIEWTTYIDCLRYLALRDELRDKILLYLDRQNFPTQPSALISDLALGTCIARIKYWMQPEPIPSYKDPHAQGEYYKRYYNTSKGAASVEQFVKAYEDIEGWINERV